MGSNRARQAEQYARNQEVFFAKQKKELERVIGDLQFRYKRERKINIMLTISLASVLTLSLLNVYFG